MIDGVKYSEAKVGSESTHSSTNANRSKHPKQKQSPRVGHSPLSLLYNKQVDELDQCQSS